MKKTILKMACTALMAIATIQTANAGGMLTNTNQSIAFLRNPAREAAIGIDGVYSNPAGVAFMNQGFHLGINWQAAWQTRQIDTTNPLFKLGAKNNGENAKLFEGEATAPFIPSIQAAYNTGKWSFQFNFAVHGGGGKCEFGHGIGSFESVIAEKAAMFGQLNELQKLSALGVPGVANIPTAAGYDMNSYMQGKQYYFGFTLGAAYKINEHLSVYGGARILYGSASYKAKISDINVVTPTGNLSLEQYVGAVSASMIEAGTFAADPDNQQAMVQGLAMNLMKQGMDPQTAKNTATATVTNGLTSLNGAAQQLASTGEALSPYLRDGVNLQSDQSAVGIAPIIGIDYKIGNFNFAGKYEFRAKMGMKNESTVKEASVIPAINKFRDGYAVREDSPASLALGAQWSVLPNVRINGGYHHFYDCEAKRYNDEQKLIDGGTNEYLGGVEWEPVKKLTVSGGFQITRYGNTDEFMNDMSFVVNSWTFCVGAKYQICDKVSVQAGYMQTNYDHYKTAANAAGVSNDFYRTNKVVGAGVEIDF